MLITPTNAMANIRTTVPSRFSRTINLPLVGDTTFDAIGRAVVADEHVEELIAYGVGIILDTPENAPVLAADPKSQLMAQSFDNLQGIARDSGYPDYEWKHLKKLSLVDYLLEKLAAEKAATDEVGTEFVDVMGSTTGTAATIQLPPSDITPDAIARLVEANGGAPRVTLGAGADELNPEGDDLNAVLNELRSAEALASSLPADLSAGGAIVTGGTPPPTGDAAAAALIAGLQADGLSVPVHVETDGATGTDAGTPAPLTAAQKGAATRAAKAAAAASTDGAAQ